MSDEKQMHDEKQLMGVPFGKMKMEDPRTGLSLADIIIWKATHRDTKYSDIPTSQEVKDHADESETMLGYDKPMPGPESEPEPDDDEPVTEEDRLRQLLTSWCKAILAYFCR